MKESIDNLSTSLLFNLRGERNIHDSIYLIFISSEDIEDLGGWPITRDYYSYAIHALKRSGAKVIGIDLFFDKNNTTFPEYNDILANFIGSSGNVVLPYTFSELISPREGLMVGLNARYPDALFLSNAAASGYSNFSKQAVLYKLPVIVSTGDSLAYSFGLELARQYSDISNPVKFIHNKLLIQNKDQMVKEIPLDEYGQIRLNHFGGVEQIGSMSFVELLQLFEKKPEQVDFKDKLVIIAVSAPGLAVLKSTPMDNLIPASVIHATVAENIINQSYIHEIPPAFEWLVIILTILLTIWLWKMYKRIIIMTIGFVFPVFYLLLSYFLFSNFNYYLPFFFPLFGFAAVQTICGWQAFKKRQYEDSSFKKLLEEQIDQKEKELKNAKNDLDNLKDSLAEENKLIIHKLESEIRDLKTYVIPKDNKHATEFKNIIHSGNSKMRNVLELVNKVSKDDIPVLILGETGTGKEIIANAIHEKSKRKNMPFVGVNCGALTETLLDSELFGHEKGSFTGANARRRGRFELANGGTIFLDEITETTPRFQARLLRVLQEGEFERVGGEQVIQVDVRIIAATNRDPQQEMEAGRFRSDLFYRLNGFPLPLPPLKERIEDIPLLCSYFLDKYKYKNISGISTKAMELMKSYSWPGNVRELENTIRRMAILAQSEQRKMIQESDLPDEIRKIESKPPTEITHKPLELQILESLRILKFARSAIGQTAKALGNKDRGTITEYFRGICFEQLVHHNFDVDTAANVIADTDDVQVIEKVKIKINDYLTNIKSNLSDLHPEDEDISNTSIYKGLPKKYHPYLAKVIDSIK